MLSLLLPAVPRNKASDGWWSGTWYGNRRQTLAGASVDEDLAMTYAWVWACCRVYCEGIASVPLVTYERTDELGNRRQATALPVYDILRYQPNAYMPAMSLREGRTLHQLNYGNGFCEIERDYRGRLTGLWPIHPGRVKPSKPGDQMQDGKPVPMGSYLVRNNDGSYIAMAPEEVLHVPGRFPEDGIWGKGCVAYARETVGMGLATERHGAVSFGHGNVPRVIVKGTGFKNDEAKRRFRSEWKQVHGSPDAGEIAILPIDADVEKLGFTNEDNQFLGTRAYNGSEICRWYGVPLHMMAAAEGQSPPTVEQLSIEFVIYGLFPIAKRWEEQCGIKLFTADERKQYFVQHDFTEVTTRCGDMQSRMTAYRIGIMIGVLAINECRRFEGLNAIGPAGDKHYVPLNMTTVEDMAAGGAMMGRGGIGSDQSGGWAENGAGEGNTDGDKGMATFESWTRRLGRVQRDDLLSRLTAIESGLRADHRAAMAPVPAAEASAARLLAAPTKASPATADDQEDLARQGVRLIEVPDVRQPNNYSCGAAAAMAVGRYFDVGPTSIDAWEKALGTDVEYSTYPPTIVNYLQQLGLAVTAAQNMTIEDLRGFWRKGMPVIVCVQDYMARREDAAKFEYGHYLTVIGCALGYVFCQDSSLENAGHVPGGDVPAAQGDDQGNIAAPGRLQVHEEHWLRVWHDMDRDGNKLVHFGIAVGRRVHPDGPDPVAAPAPPATPTRGLPVGKAEAGEVRNSVPALAAAKNALGDVLRRMFGKEARAAARAGRSNRDWDAWLADFYGKHELQLAEALAPACAMLSAAGVPVDSGRQARRLCAESRFMLASAYNSGTRAAFDAMLADWSGRRVDDEVSTFGDRE